MKQVIQTSDAPAPIGPYNQAIKVGPWLYISGQIPIHPASGELVSSNIESEARQVMENLKAILTEAGLSFADAVKSTILLSDMNNFAQVNKVYGGYFSSDFPVRETYAVKTLPKNVGVEISMIAYSTTSLEE